MPIREIWGQNICNQFPDLKFIDNFTKYGLPCSSYGKKKKKKKNLPAMQER